MKISSTHYALAFFLLFLYASCGEDAVEINDTSDFEDFVANEMEGQHIPAVSVLIFEEGQVLYQKQFGYANLEQARLLDSEDMFLIASISKVVTATALLQLYDSEAFDLDDDINDYLPFAVRNPAYAAPITFRMLLTHTSGIADNDPVLDGQYYYNQDPPISLSYFMENYFVPGGEFYNANENFFDFAPGAAHEYSNIGSALIGVLVERISGLDFNTYCKNNIFNPLGMVNTSWRLDEITQNIVTPYDYLNRENQPIAHYTNTDFPNGGLRTTARDMFALLAALANDGQYGNFRLLSAATAQAIRTPQIPSIDSEVGLHFFLMDNTYNLWGHDGGEQGVATIMGFNPVTKIGAIILSNQGEADLDEFLSSAYQLGGKL